MGFKLGTYSIKLKSYNHNELALDTKYSHLEFELFQKVFHFFLIPSYPVERFWKVTNSKTGAVETTDASLRTALNIKSLKSKIPG